MAARPCGFDSHLRHYLELWGLGAFPSPRFVFVGCVIGVAWLIYVIILAIQSYQGKWFTIPFLTDLCKKQDGT